MIAPVRALESMLATRVHVSPMLPMLVPNRGWVHHVELPAEPMLLSPARLVVSPLMHWLLKYDQANKTHARQWI